MMDKEQIKQARTALQPVIKKQVHTRSFNRKSRQSLFTSQISQQRMQEIKQRYFMDSQIQLLAKFLELPEVQALSLDELLACHSMDANKSELQLILRGFITGKIDSVHTAKRLESFIHKSKPLAWKLWRVFDLWRYQKLDEFIKHFKSNCLKDIVRQNLGYNGAANIYEEPVAGINPSRAAANFHRNDLRLADVESQQEQREYASLFLKIGKGDDAEQVIYTKPKENNAQIRSFFKVNKEN